MSEKSADIVELFSSVQGEGPLIGVRQLFIRFHGCNLKCSYCDTNIETVPSLCVLERSPGKRDFIERANPVNLPLILSHLEGWGRGWPGAHHSISITGGEPLLHLDVLLEWLPILRKILPIYIETNGLIYSGLPRLMEFIDYTAMDIKVPSTSGCNELWEQHEEFIGIASQKTLFVKVVVSDTTEEWEVERACEIVAGIDPGITLVLQPVTLKEGKIGISPIKCLELQDVGCNYLRNVRIIPQTHKFIGQL